MKFCVYGAGAIGGYLAVELALSGQEVCVVARGAHLDAIKERGLKLVIQGREKVARVAAAEDPAVLGVQDVVICALKVNEALGVQIPGAGQGRGVVCSSRRCPLSVGLRRSRQTP